MNIFFLTIFSAFFCADIAHCCKNNCAAEMCLDVKTSAEKCVDQGLAYVYPDIEKCNCCGGCAPVKEVIDPKALQGCDPKMCETVKCAPEDPNNCRKGQIYAPYDGVCFCCPQCAPAKCRKH